MADQPIGRLIRVRAGRCCSADPTTPPACGPATSARDDVHRRRSADVARADRPVVDRRPALRPRPGVERAPPHCAAPCTSTMHRAARVRLARSCGARSSAEQLPRPTKAPQPLWGWGPIPPDLVALWQAYLARFASAHTCRFFKQTLQWTTPTRRLPAAADRWTSSWPTSSGAWPATGSPMGASPGSRPWRLTAAPLRGSVGAVRSGWRTWAAQPTSPTPADSRQDVPRASGHHPPNVFLLSNSPLDLLNLATMIPYSRRRSPAGRSLLVKR